MDPTTTPPSSSLCGNSSSISTEPSDTSSALNSKICNIAECINWADLEAKYIPEKCAGSTSGSSAAPRSRKKQKISRLQSRIRGLYQDRINMEAERVSIERENKALLSEMEFIIKTVNALNARHATHTFNRVSSPTESSPQVHQQFENSGSYSESSSTPIRNTYENPQIIAYNNQSALNRATEVPHFMPQMPKQESQSPPLMFPQGSPVDLQAMFPEPLSTYLPPAQPGLFPNPYIHPGKMNNMHMAPMNPIPVVKGSDNIFPNGNFLNPFAPYTIQPQDCSMPFDQNYTIPPPMHPYGYASPSIPIPETAYAPRQSSDFSIWFQSVLADYTPR